MKDEIRYRLATAEHAFPLMRLFQKAANNVFEDPLFLDHAKLVLALKSDDYVCVVGEINSEVVSVLSVKLEREHRLAKIHRMYSDPSQECPVESVKSCIVFFINETARENRKIDVIYATTRTLNQDQLELCLKLEFKVLGVFPLSDGKRELKTNGIVAYFFKDVLADRFARNFPLHPDIQPLFEITRRECGFKKLPVARIPIPASEIEPLPIQEVIHAPNFVARRFNFLKERKFLSLNFYPFQEPNAIVTDPDQKIEVFVKMTPEIRFATIIGERIESAVNPSDLYKSISSILYNLGISYIEVINDAADTEGIENILNAGFLPCAYFPALKYSEETRRDFVILWKSFERLTFPKSEEINDIFRDYLDCYLLLEKKRLRKGRIL